MPTHRISKWLLLEVQALLDIYEYDRGQQLEALHRFVSRRYNYWQRRNAIKAIKMLSLEQHSEIIKYFHIHNKDCEGERLPDGTCPYQNYKKKCSHVATLAAKKRTTSQNQRDH
jgi:hypothetical protein